MLAQRAACLRLHLLEQNLNKIDWNFLSQNINAIHLLENNLNKIDWNELCKNQNASAASSLSATTFVRKVFS
jgi:hypothetical protein